MQLMSNDAFKQYFIKSWDTCKEKWVTFLYAMSMFHFANTTNNLLECHNHKLKHVTSHSMSFSKIFQKVLLFSQSNACTHTHTHTHTHTYHEIDEYSDDIYREEHLLNFSLH